MKKQTTLKRLLHFVKPHMHYLILAMLCAVAGTILTLAAPVFIGDAIDFIIAKGQVDFASIRHILMILLISVLCAAIFNWLMAYFTNLVSYKTVSDIRCSVFLKFSKVPLSFVDQNPRGDLISRMINDVDLIGNGFLQGFTQVFSGAITILGTLAFMLSVNVSIALVVVVLTPLSLFAASFIAKKSHNYFTKQAETRGEIGGFIEEMVGGEKVLKAFGYEERAQEKFDEINARLYESGVKSQFYSALTNPTTRFVNNLVFAAVGICGAIAVLFGHFSVGKLSAFLAYANQYTKPFNDISNVVTELQTAFASARRVLDVLGEKEEEPDPKDAVKLAECHGDVELTNVGFSYKKDVPFIENLSLKVKSGQRIAIVGPTGCGKTTVINLLMRFYDVNSGQISIDGHPILSLTKDSLRQNFGMVLQDTWLFNGTVRDNIAYGCEDATDEAITLAAKSAYAHSFIKRLSKGYDTVIEEGGGNISQGQRQLLCIARVMLTKPSMLILDEATSSIDTRTEIKIQKAFLKMMENRTSFVVAHRLSTIKEADVILVMKDGHIIEKGTHDELLGHSGFYANLYNSQFAPNE